MTASPPIIGQRGATGPRGFMGPKGDSIVGPRGAMGLEGETGPRGEKGEKGDRGSLGLEGVKGDRGLRGAKGTDGKDGKDADLSEVKILALDTISKHEKEFDHSLIDPFLIGSKELDESGIGDKKVLQYHAKTQKIIYTTIKETIGKGNFMGSGFRLPSQDGNAGKFLQTNGTLSSWAALVNTIGVTIDGGGSVITTGSKGYIAVPYSCTITGVTLLADQSGSVVIDIKKSTYANFPTTTSIVASAPPTITSAQKNTDTTLTGWTTAVTAGDVIEFLVTSVTSITRLNVVLSATHS